MKSLQELEKEFVDLLGSIKREGIEELIPYMQGLGFFKAPAAMLHHDNCIGGLMYHSLMVYKIFKEKINYYDIDFPEDSVRICGLLHDMCKMDYYKQKDTEKATEKQIEYIEGLLERGGPDNALDVNRDTITKKFASKYIGFLKGDNEKPNINEVEWEIDDNLPLGHGEKSIFILERFIDLSVQEAVAIRWHMSFSDLGVHFRYPSGKAYEDAMLKFPTTILLFTSDFEARMVSDIRKKLGKV